jgi:hypothetical protein
MNNSLVHIAPAFIKAKKAFGPALKDKANPAFRSKYADLGACLEAVDDALLDNGIAVYQETFEDASGVTVETVFLHESGETIRSGKLHVPASKQDPQGYGSALTYCRRYSLMAACGIAPEDDDGNAASGRNAPKQPKSTPAPEAPQGPVTDAAAIATHISALESCRSLETLKHNFAEAWKATRGAPAVKAAYESYKAELSKPQPEAAPQ